MNIERTYRELLLNTIASIEDGHQDLLVIGMELVMFEDRKAGNIPFEDGDLIPVYIDVFKASDIPAVQIIAGAVLLIPEICLSLRNINMVTDEEIEQLYVTDSEETEPESPTGKELTMDDFISEVYLCLSDIIFFINSNAYWMIHGEEASEDVYTSFYLPEEETYELLGSTDNNIQMLVSLSKDLLYYRELVYAD